MKSKSVLIFIFTKQNPLVLLLRMTLHWPTRVSCAIVQRDYTINSRRKCRRKSSVLVLFVCLFFIYVLITRRGANREFMIVLSGRDVSAPVHPFIRRNARTDSLFYLMDQF